MVCLEWGSEPPSNRKALFLSIGLNEKMVKYLDEINYDELIEQSLRNVVYLALKVVEEQGLPGQNHFYITFKTDFPGVVLSQNLKLQYPDTITIVLQNQFSNLQVRHNSFSVDLSFGGLSQTIKVPYESITYFADPSAKFGLNFASEEMMADSLKLAAGDGKKSAEKIQSEEAATKGADIISFDSFRRKK